MTWKCSNCGYLNTAGVLLIGRERAARVLKANADEFAERLRPVLAVLDGLSASAAARELEERGFATARGGKWTPLHVIRLRARLGASY